MSRQHNSVVKYLSFWHAFAVLRFHFICVLPWVFPLFFGILYYGNESTLMTSLSLSMLICGGIFFLVFFVVLCSWTMQVEEDEWETEEARQIRIQQSVDLILGDIRKHNPLALLLRAFSQVQRLRS